MLISSSLLGWYPEYSVLASEFVVGQGFLAPTTFRSMSVYTLGSSFSDLSKAPLDVMSHNPAADIQIDGPHYFHLDLGRQNLDLFEDPNPMNIHLYDYYPGPWSFYNQGEEKADYDPAFRMVYVGYPLKALEGLRLGAAVDWMYELSQFYQPYDMWGFGYRDAFGAEYAVAEVDPYDDYRIRQSGDDENTNEGYHATFFASHPMGSHTNVGLRFTAGQETVDGQLNNYNFDDQSDYRDEYLSLYQSQTSREQDFSSYDLMIGLEKELQTGATLGVSLGMLSADMDRGFSKLDSSNYYGMTYDQYPDISGDDSTYYLSNSAHDSDKRWQYVGETFYGGLQYKKDGAEGLTYRFALYAEQRNADLTESETLYQSNHYHSRYFLHSQSTMAEYLSTTWARISRTGSGIFEQSLYRGSAGVNWTVSPTFMFLGGLYFHQKDRLQTANEPFTGAKYSFWDRSEATYDPGIDERYQEDDQEFRWERNEHETTVGIPVGIVLEFGEYFQFRSGLTKIFRKTEVAETYDVVVIRRLEEHGDGTTTTSEESSFVDGFEFPTHKAFDNTFNYNAGLSFAFDNNFEITMALGQVFEEEFFIKIGGQINW